jgi:cytochrome c-type biogenesis protein CcmE
VANSAVKRSSAASGRIVEGFDADAALTRDLAVDTLAHGCDEGRVFMSKGLQIAGGATLIALLLGWYAATNLEAGASFAYYQTLADFQATATSESAQHARIRGFVAIGSIERDLAAKQVRFRIQNHPPRPGEQGERPLPVVYAGLETPDLFKDGAEVVIEGTLAGADGEVYFQADKVLAKCPSKFGAKATEAARF